jgi:hypothetical protein
MKLNRIHDNLTERDIAGVFLLLLAVIVFLPTGLLTFSCANQGVGPGGGPRDSIAPVVIRSIPENYQTNVTNNQIEVIFNEYVQVEKLNEKLVISPPLSQKPIIRLKGKGVVLKLNEELIPDRTYSIDFKDGIKDYNEGNVLESFRMIFSTYDELDTLRIAGKLLDAFTLAPVNNGVVTLYNLDEDSVFKTRKPDFIAKTNKSGRFLFDNLPNDGYKLYALTDGDNNLIYNQPSENIAFIDSFLFVNAFFVAQTDTLILEGDTVVSQGYTQYLPDSVTCLMFSEKQYNQYMRSLKRPERERISMGFTESLCDSFAFHLTGKTDTTVWYYSEINLKRDSVDIWITDSLLAAQDTLLLSVDYTRTLRDGTNQFSTDTVKFIYTAPKARKTKKDNEATEEAKTTPSFKFSSNLKGGDCDLNLKIDLESQWPIDTFPSEKIRFEKLTSDTSSVLVSFTIIPEMGSKRKYSLDFKMEEATRYKLSVDSAAIYSSTGIPNDPWQLSFKTQKADFYGSIILGIQGFEGKGIVYLLRHSDKEEVVDTLHYHGQKEIVFHYVKPEKFRVKLLDDRDGNGEWTTGELATRRQPERVYYFPKVVKVRSNWESKESWLIDPTKIEDKSLLDSDQEQTQP